MNSDLRAVIKALLVRIRSETLDESASNASDPLERARDLGYRAGWNDRVRSVCAEMEAVIGSEVPR